MRPLSAYTMGWIHRWSRLAELAPWLANLTMPLLKPLTGIAKERKMPKYARKTFRQLFRESTSEPNRRVVLWPDTFNNHFHPDTALAAVEVLEAAGYHVTIPRKRLCCGRPLYDWGFLKIAKKLLREILDTLAPEIDEGVAIVGLEPSCVSVFRDELVNLFPNDVRAKKLSKLAMTLSEFIEREGDRFKLPHLEGKALVQAHCHHAAILAFPQEEKVLKAVGLDVHRPDSGCCGMAGAFGFEEKNYEVSTRLGERVLIPEVRAAAPETLIVADGFSCREQIHQMTGRETLHLAQVLRKAMRAQRGK
jgi:Fe-S oxidoreductase